VKNFGDTPIIYIFHTVNPVGVDAIIATSIKHPEKVKLS